MPYTAGNEPALFLGRGYTGHEHLYWFGLVNMNARLYDPLLGRFLSPDPYVQMPDFTQNFNRYSYCLNNPLVYVDENGEFIFSFLLPGIGTIIDAACWGAVINAGMYTASVALSPGGFNNWSWKNFGFAALSGAINGALSQVLPINIPIGGNSGLSLSIAPQIAIGSDGIGFGFNAYLGYNFKGFNAGINFGGSYYASAAGTGASGFEGRLGYGIGYQSKHFQAGIGGNYFFSGKTSQLTGQMYAGGRLSL